MNPIDRLYTVDNYKIQKFPKIENELYERLKELMKKYDAQFSELVNVCIEDLLKVKDNIEYYKRPEDEIAEYRSVMIRVKNYEGLEKIKEETKISIERLINLSIKRFMDEYDKQQNIR